MYFEVFKMCRDNEDRQHKLRYKFAVTLMNVGRNYRCYLDKFRNIPRSIVLYCLLF